ncbi:lipocalin family protein [Methylomonas fluvii]|uniref:Outer membrane lipoprotein Blc n=1 Tax=Methylomonas fluvii TaxID=1854564 RepID=A0ABR9DE39_9GAMM|nr:lipocalin family protein [Methylomonas fluvii]MBD9361046.1 lipocalin family protein [Methylomonas fluvii]CAD6873945.1 Outer membrane lipoprotein Blc [Methylomonas fluvii]
MRYLPILLLSLLCACTGIPEGIKVIDGFELERYLGTWYEIARLDHSFERGLTDISAEYSLRDDGGVKVLNSGYDAEQGQRKIAEGKAYFIDKPDIGRLKVSFFGPFYGAYNIIALDKNAYRYVMIAGPDRDYLWILARSPELEPSIQQDLIQQAKSLGFATDKLIFDQHPKQ